jgi:hypothetical protein
VPDSEAANGNGPPKVGLTRLQKRLGADSDQRKTER